MQWSAPKLTPLACLLTGVMGAALFTGAAAAQEPANQDKLGKGATEKQLPASQADKDSSPAGAPVDGKKSDADATAPPASEAGGRKGHGGAGHGGEAAGAPEKVAYDYELPGPDGKALPVSTYKGKVLLVVNLAHDSMYATQLAALEKLNEQYKDKGLVVIGVPSNNFGSEEPGTDAELQKIYKVDDKVTFPVMAKSELTGVQELPFYTYLTGVKAVPENGPVHWNYTKFLVGKDGKLIARFAPDVAPDSPQLESTLDQVLAGTYKPVTPGQGRKPGGPGMGDDDN
jgi:glutathione peroxidase